MEFEGKQVVSGQVERLLEWNQKLSNELDFIKSKVTYRVYEENMALVDEIIKLKAELNKNRPFGPVEEVPELQYKYTLIVSQYYHSRHMFIVHHTADFIEKARKFAMDLVFYKGDNLEALKKRTQEDGYDERIGDLSPKYADGPIRPRYNINCCGDIYFVQSNYANYLADTSRKYQADSIRERNRGYIKKAVSEAIGKHHDYDVVKKLVEKYFVIA